MIIRLVAVLLRNSGIVMISANYVLIDSLGKKSLRGFVWIMKACGSG